VPVLDDLLGEGDETYTVQLSGPSGGATLAKAIGTGTILDDEPIITIGDVSVNEAISGRASRSST